MAADTIKSAERKTMPDSLTNGFSVARVMEARKWIT